MSLRYETSFEAYKLWVPRLDCQNLGYTNSFARHLPAHRVHMLFIMLDDETIVNWTPKEELT